MSAAIEVRVPDIGDSKDVPVLEVLVKPGTRVEADTPVITLETEKATIDVPAPAAGVVKDIAVRTGERVSRGALILTIVAGEGAPSEPRSEPKRAREAAPADIAPQPPPSAPSAPSPAPASASALSPPASPPSKLASVAVEAPPYTSPSVRARCRRLEIDPKTIQGSGPGDRILESDLDAYLRERLHEPASPRAHAPTPAIDFERFGPIEPRRLSHIEKRTAARLAQNWTTIPHVTNFEDADVTDLESFRKTVNAEEGVRPKLTMLAFLVKASAAALREFPDINASLAGDVLVRKRYCHIGFAADTPAGLLVPVIRDADKKGLLQIAVEASQLASRARDGKLTVSDMEGGCFTVSSLGAIGGKGFTPIINAPEIAILGAARAQIQPYWDGKQFVPRLMLPLALSWDHRAVSGAPAARFLAFIASRLTDSRLLLL